MKIDATVHLHFPPPDGVLALFNELKELIMSTQQEITEGLAAATTQLQKIAVESAATVQKVADLEVVIANMGNTVSPELQAAFDALKAQVQVVDDIVPDAVA